MLYVTSTSLCLERVHGALEGLLCSPSRLCTWLHPCPECFPFSSFSDQILFLPSEHGSGVPSPDFKAFSDPSSPQVWDKAPFQGLAAVDDVYTSLPCLSLGSFRARMPCRQFCLPYGYHSTQHLRSISKASNGGIHK